MISERPMAEVVSENFERYAGNVILDRAICDVRDMLKPSARMLIYSQLEITKNTHKKPFIKSARVVGDCLGRLYEHGDSSCYGSYMRMAKPFAMRYPLESCQGNHGTIAGDAEAAMRYTELRLNELASYIYNGLKENAIDEWRSNFDETMQYPGVMPSIGYFNICNGTTGLGIAISSSIPQFNLREVNQALIQLIHNKDYQVDILPDFATGAILTNEMEVRESLKSGSGKACRLRAKLQYRPSDNSIVVTEVPYGVMTSSIKKAIENKIETDENYGVESVNDNSGGDTPEMYIMLSKGTNPDKMIAKLYHDTPLESHFTINMWVLKDGRFPALMGLTEIFQNYIDHIRICKRREVQFDLDKTLARENIVNGLLIAAANIDEVIAIIRTSETPMDATEKLIARYHFNQEQTRAILAMRLSSLTKVDAIKLEYELEELKQQIELLQHLLNDSTALDEELIKILQFVADKFGDARRTTIENILGDEEEPEEIQEQDLAILWYANSLKIVNMPLKIRGTQPRDIIYTTNLRTIVGFTDAGKMYTAFVRDFKLNQEYTLNKVFSCRHEKILVITDISTLMSYSYLTCITHNGLIKKSATSDYAVRAKKGTSILKLNDEDNVVNVILSGDNDKNIVIISNNNYYNCYSLDNITQTGRQTKGIKAIKLNEGEYVTRAFIDNDNIYITTPRASRGIKNA